MTLHRVSVPRARAPRMPSRRHARGLTLIEILVTMVLLGVGLLGLAGLQLRGMQVNQGSTFRSQAAILAEDMADRMRADIATASTQGYDGNWQYGTPSPTAAATAVALVQDWLFRLASLPSGCAKVTTVGGATQILITWDDTRAMRSANPLAPAAIAPCTVGAGNGAYLLTTQ